MHEKPLLDDLKETLDRFIKNCGTVDELYEFRDTLNHLIEEATVDINRIDISDCEVPITIGDRHIGNDFKFSGYYDLDEEVKEWLFHQKISFRIAVKKYKIFNHTVSVRVVEFHSPEDAATFKLRWT